MPKLTITTIAVDEEDIDNPQCYRASLTARIEGVENAHQALAIFLTSLGGAKVSREAEATPVELGTAEEPAAEEAPVEEEPKRKRGRPRKTEAVETPAEPAQEEASRRRRRPEKPVDTSTEERTITDADLMKACSSAARKITPAKVTEKLEEFGVAEARELTPEQRAEFVDWANAVEAN